MVTNIDDLYGATVDQLTDKLYDEEDESFDEDVLDFMADREVGQQVYESLEQDYDQTVTAEFQEAYDNATVNGLLTGAKKQSSLEEPQTTIDPQNNPETTESNEKGFLTG